MRTMGTVEMRYKTLPPKQHFCTVLKAIPDLAADFILVAKMVNYARQEQNVSGAKYSGLAERR